MTSFMSLYEHIIRHQRVVLSLRDAVNAKSDYNKAFKTVSVNRVL